jgi:tetrapyrrole methylase family protein / MazG family protein
MNPVPSQRRAFQSLVEVVKALRGPEGCPWDKEQTHQTLTRFAIEEAHELAEAIDSGHLDHVREELGDLLLQVVLHAEIARQAGTFEIEDVIEGLCDKMIRRHPHVFGDADLKTTAQVLDHWGKIKAKEKPATAKADGFGLPPHLPALMGSQKIGEKTHREKFDWASAKDVLVKLQEEISEFSEALADQDGAALEHELGDILFTAAQLARFFRGDAEQALRKTNQRFERRYFKMRSLAKGEFADLPAPEKEKLWAQAKKLVD